MAQDNQAGKTYELAGDTANTLAELTEMLAESDTGASKGGLYDGVRVPLVYVRKISD